MMGVAAALTLALAGCRGADGARDERTAASAAPPPAVGQPMPEYRAVTLTGDSVRIGGPGRGPLTFVNVWATWCTSCREEMADLEVLHRELAGRGLHVVAVSVDAGPTARMRRFVEREQLTLPMVHDPEARIQRTYGVVGIPSSYLVGPDGRLLWQQVGGIHGATRQVREVVQRYTAP
jgi:peroxiredoxin